MSRLFKRTKILATIGPASSSAEKIEELIMAGVNGCRLNFSHGNYEERDEQLRLIRAAAAKKGRSVAILQDLQGPKIRLGEIKGNHYDIKAGDEIILDSAVEKHDGGNVLPIQYNLASRVKVGEPLSMFDGKIKATVKKIESKTAIRIKCENDGFVMTHKGLNLPDTDFGGDIITEKDLADIEFGASRDFDYVAMSFVQSAADIEKLRQILLSHGSTAKIIAKIETKKAIESDERMEEIVKATDGIMVARGDMAVEAGNEVVPIVQRKLMALCRKHSKLCIVATQMLGSMVDSPEPTRAEVSDVATAVIQGADVVMLSDETANGTYPVETVKEMKRVILYAQNHSRLQPLATFMNALVVSEDAGESTIFAKEVAPDLEHLKYTAVSRAAARLAEQIDADVIVCQTATGTTAAAIAAERPNLPIISVTSNPRVAGQLALYYANSAFVRPFSETCGLDLAQELKASGYIQPHNGDEMVTAVIVSGQPNTPGGTDTIQVRRI